MHRLNNNTTDDAVTATTDIIDSILASLPASSVANVIDTDVPLQLRAKLSKQTQRAMAKAAQKKASLEAKAAAESKRRLGLGKAIRRQREYESTLSAKYSKFIRDITRKGHECQMSMEEWMWLWQNVPDVKVFRTMTSAIDLRRPFPHVPRTGLKRIDDSKPFSLDNVKVMLWKRRADPSVCIYPDGLSTDDPVIKVKRKRKAKYRKRKSPKVVKRKRTKAEIIDYINSMP